MSPISIVNTGMITGVGLSTDAACAALRVGVTGFRETRFLFDGDWIDGSEVSEIGSVLGREKLVKMLRLVLCESLRDLEERLCRETTLILCLAESARPGRPTGIDESLLRDVQTQLSVRFHPSSMVICEGRVGGIKAVDKARRLIAEGRKFCVVAGVDSLLVAESLDYYHAQRRLLTSRNSDGFIPGEAAAAILFGLPDGREAFVTCRGIGYGTEPSAVDPEVPLRAEGLTAAIRMALSDAERSFEQIHFRVADHNGEQSGFKEAALALARTMRPVKPTFDVWHPSDCIGEVGAAFIPCALSWIATAARRGYAPGPGVLCHAGELEERAAMVIDFDKRGHS